MANKLSDWLPLLEHPEVGERVREAAGANLEAWGILFRFAGMDVPIYEDEDLPGWASAALAFGGLTVLWDRDKSLRDDAGSLATEPSLDIHPDPAAVLAALRKVYGKGGGVPVRGCPPATDRTKGSPMLAKAEITIGNETHPAISDGEMMHVVTPRALEQSAALGSALRLIDALTAERDRLREALHGLFAQATADAVHPDDEEDFEAAMSFARDLLSKTRALIGGSQ